MEAPTGADTGSAEPENTDGKVFIGGLSWETTSDSLRYYFEKFGELSDVALMADKRTGQPRGFGFVSYKDPAGNSLSGHFELNTDRWLMYILFSQLWILFWPSHRIISMAVLLMLSARFHEIKLQRRRPGNMSRGKYLLVGYHQR